MSPRETQSGPQRVPLRHRKRVQVGRVRKHELVQAAITQLCLRLDSRQPGDLEAARRRRANCFVEQRGLAHPRFAAQDRAPLKPSPAMASSPPSASTSADRPKNAIPTPLHPAGRARLPRNGGCSAVRLLRAHCEHTQRDAMTEARPGCEGDAVDKSGDHLKAGQLGTADVTASTVANIGPGIDFYFGFGVIAVTAGVAAPLTILAATVAVALLAFTVAEFTRAEPSAGSFITYVETSLGARAGVATALLVTVGYTVAIAAVFTMSGGMVAMTLVALHLLASAVGATILPPDRGRDLADRTRNKAVNRRGRRGRGRAGGDHARGLRPGPRRSA